MKRYKQLYVILALVLLTLLPFFIISCGVGRAAVEVSVEETPSPEQTLPAPYVVPSLPPSPDPMPAPSPEAAIQPQEEPSPEPEPEKAPIEAWPVRMCIPALNIDTEIQDTGTDHAVNSMAIAPSGTIISWWRESAIPGNEGNAIFGGHNKWSGELGLLYSLDTLAIGDEMDIEYADGTMLKFMLESVFVYALATAPANIIMDTGGEARVTVITCKEPFNPQIGTSDNRIVAIFKPEIGFVIPDPPVEPYPPREAKT